MNSNVIKLLLVLCGALLLVLLIEWQFSASTESQLEDLIAEDEKHQVESRELPEISLSKKAIDKYSMMVEKPLFIKGRQPVENVEEQVVNQQGGKIEDLLLVGIYSTKGHLMALFVNKKSDKKYLKKAEGDDVSGWLLREIQEDRVILESAGREETIMLRKPKPGLKSFKKFKPALPKKIKLKS